MTDKHDSESFPAECRLRLGEDFRRVYDRRRSVADDLMILYACENGLRVSRIGLSVSRKHGNAVRRNRWKRLFREAFRQQRAKLPTGYDFVLMPRQGATPELATIATSLDKLIARVVKRLEREQS